MIVKHIRGSTKMAGLRVSRKKPRKAAPGRTFFNSRGLPVSVRNAPNVRRLRRKRRK